METHNLNYYANNTPNGTYLAFVWEYLHAVDYGMGRLRDLVLFAICDDSKMLSMDKEGQPMMCVAVMNVTKQKSGKAKINKLKRCLIKKEHNINAMQSYRALPDIESFCMGDDLQGHTYKIKVENKTVNGKTVSNITHVFSYLAGDFVDIRGVFDKA
tara:strand:- start:725 stop:1195 length:471 start_codon:yes stop_codon:yes gene_type:complete